jgi:hypothetical protein
MRKKENERKDRVRVMRVRIRKKVEKEKVSEARKRLSQLIKNIYKCMPTKEPCKMYHT